MASTFLTRLRVGGKLVDAKGVSRLYRSRISAGALLLLVRRRVRRDRRRGRGVRGRPDLSRSARRQVGRLLPLASGRLVVISFRYHVVSIVAVFLALALGVVVGTTALNGPITTDLRNKVDSLNKQRAADVSRHRTAAAAGEHRQPVRRRRTPRRSSAVRLTGDQVIMIGMPGATSAHQGRHRQRDRRGRRHGQRPDPADQRLHRSQARRATCISLVKQVQPIGLNLPGDPGRRQPGRRAAGVRAVRRGSAERHQPGAVGVCRPRRCSRSRAAT